MSRAASKKPPANKPAKPWIAWKTSGNWVRVQIHDPTLANAFSRIKGVERAGYGVGGGYMRIFMVKKSVNWVRDWMKAHLKK